MTINEIIIYIEQYDVSRIYDMDNDGYISNGELFQVSTIPRYCSSSTIIVSSMVLGHFTRDL